MPLINSCEVAYTRTRLYQLVLVTQPSLNRNQAETLSYGMNMSCLRNELTSYDLAGVRGRDALYDMIMGVPQRT